MKKKVLIIEDNLDLQDIYRINFEAEDFLVEVSDDGMDGIIKMLDKSPDIIILDIMMPKVNGFELLQTIKNQSSLHIPTIVCSNLNSKDDEEKAFELGADLYLRKSDYEWDEIVKQAIKLLEK
jgi:DNA-binding response OmpR family regulator